MVSCVCTILWEQTRPVVHKTRVCAGITGSVSNRRKTPQMQRISKSTENLKVPSRSMYCTELASEMKIRQSFPNANFNVRMKIQGTANTKILSKKFRWLYLKKPKSTEPVINALFFKQQRIFQLKSTN